MEPFGNILATVIAQVVTLTEGTLAAYVDITTVSGNITNISLSPTGQAFCTNWSNLIVTFAGSMDRILHALSATSTLVT